MAEKKKTKPTKEVEQKIEETVEDTNPETGETEEDYQEAMRNIWTKMSETVTRIADALEKRNALDEKALDEMMEQEERFRTEEKKFGQSVPPPNVTYSKDKN